MFQEERFRALSSSHHPQLQQKFNTPKTPPPAPVGSGGRSRTSTNSNVCGRDDSGLSPEDLGEDTNAEREQRFNDDQGEHMNIAAEGHHERASGEQRSGPQDGSTRMPRVANGDSQRVWGSRPLALEMFQRAAELGHPRAIEEVRRLRLRERMDNLTRAGCRPQARGQARR